MTSLALFSHLSALYMIRTWYLKLAMRRAKPRWLITQHAPHWGFETIPDFHDGRKKPEGPENYREPQEESGNRKRPRQAHQVIVGR